MSSGPKDWLPSRAGPFCRPTGGVSAPSPSVSLPTELVGFRMHGPSMFIDGRVSGSHLFVFRPSDWQALHLPRLSGKKHHWGEDVGGNSAAYL